MVHEKIAMLEHIRFMKKMIMLTPGLTEEEKKEKIIMLNKHFNELMQTKWWTAENIRKRKANYIKNLKKNNSNKVIEPT
ncbi:MAG: hypothetical protein PHV17_06715 [Candidatus Omnitrophica bacterium]|nr:hypothetical protein [Candidatus Omnitrophota bacterium]